MKRILLTSMLLAVASVPCHGQTLEDLNIQIHGYATQGFLYTTNNNILTTPSSDGSPAWTEAVLNVSSQPTPKLRISVQGRYYLLGNYGDAITLDYASADYKFNDKIGVRFGKTKVPSGLFNEIQDIDPSYMWSLLPQGVYPIASRDGILAVYGGVVYGQFKLSPQLGKIEYRGWSGEVSLPAGNGYFTNFGEAGLNLYSGITYVENGGALHWVTPLSGLMIGASYSKKNTEQGPVTAANGALSGNFIVAPFSEPNYFAKYEKHKLMLATEWQREGVTYRFQFAGPTATPAHVDPRGWYAMASYKVTGKLTAGIYDSQSIDHQAALGPARYSKDWAFSGRYDFSDYVYAKAEEHVIDGTQLSYDSALNPNGLKPNTKLTVLKIGVSF